MLYKYKEIFYGIVFGLGAAAMDTAMDALIEHRTFGAELVKHPAMVLYRVLFLLFGLTVGWRLWQRNKHERDFRGLAETVKRFQQECGRDALVMHAKLQVVLTRQDLHLSPEAEELVQAVYQQVREIQRRLKEELPPLGD